MKEFVYKNRNKIFNIIVLLIYSIITLKVVLNHEMYENEVQSYLIARDLNYIDIIKQMIYEGHSFLWHFIISPVAKLGFPMQCQGLITWGFSLLTAILILTKTKLNKIMKLFFIFSPGMLYFSCAIVRPYCLIPLFLVLISMLYETKDEHPYLYAILIVLLANTHLVMMPTACLLALFHWGKKIIKKDPDIKKKSFWLSLLITILGILMFIVIILLSIVNMNLVTDCVADFSYTSRSFGNVIGAFVLLFNRYFSYLTGNFITPTYLKIIILLALIIGLIGIKERQYCLVYL